MLIYLILNTFSFFLNAIGFRGIRCLAVFLGILSFDILRIRRKIILENLDIAFSKSKTQAEKIKIGRASVVSFFTTLLEFFPAQKLFPKVKVTYTHREVPVNVIARNQGLYAMCIHMSNWEFLCHINSKLIPISVVVKPIGKGTLAKWVEQTRKAIGFCLIDRKGNLSARSQIFSAIDRKEAVGFIIDQKRSSGEVLPFFGKQASTNNSLAKLYLRKPAPIVPVILKRTGMGEYHVIYFPEFIVDVDPSLSFAQKVTNITQRMNSLAEDMIRMNPEEYFWMHNRWNLKS